MSASKRRRTDDDDGEVDIESASSSLRQTNNKRPRTVLAAENGGSVVSDDDDESAGDPRDDDRNNDDEDEIDPEETAFYLREFSKHRDNVEMENGIIEEVHCTNFMCHSKFSVSLGPLINFVIGHNGSGKSAVLTALTICLGNKASSTNRGANLKSMIKEGTDAATIRVKIKNRGADAYQPDLYGRSVIVERHFTRSGHSQFKLKNSEGKVISNKKRDLDDIIDYWGLQLDNPINVLNQDMARQFLSNSTPHDKYKFFIKGTQLEILDTDYNILEEEVDKLHHRLINSTDDLKESKQRMKDAEARKKRLEASDSIRMETNRIMRMHAWAQVEEQEKIAEERQAQVAAAEQNILQAEHDAESSAGLYESAQQVLQSAAQKVKDLEEALEPARDDHKRELEQFEAGKAKLQELQNSVRGAKVEYSSMKAKKEKLEKSISDENALLADINGQEHNERMERMEQLRLDLAQAQEDSRAHQAALAGVEQARTAAAEEVERAKEPQREYRNKVQTAENVLQSMQRDQNRRFTGYKRGMENLVNAVDRETRWLEKPIGPLGLHCKLLKPEWMGLIEKWFGQALDQFVVTSRQDQALLVDVMKRAGCSTSILIGNAGRLDTSANEPDERLLTVLRAMHIDNVLVRNSLIISNNIEQVVLVKDRNTGQQIMNERRPNVKSVLTFRTNDGRDGGVRFDLSRSGAQRSSPLQVWSGAPRMQTNMEHQLEHQRGVIAAARREMDDCERLIRAKHTASTAAQQAYVKWQRERNGKLTAGQQISDSMEALQEEIDRNRPEDGRLQELERQLEEAVASEAAQNGIVTDLVVQRSTIDESQRAIKARLDELQNDLNSHNERLDEAKAEERDLAEQRMTALKQKNEAFAQIDDNKKLHEEAKQRLEAQMKVVNEEFIPGAERISARVAVPEGMTVAKLDDRMDRMKRDLARAEQEAGGSKERVFAEYEEASRVHKRAAAIYKNLQELREALQKALIARKQRWNSFRQRITSRARINFGYLLSERNFRGNIILDHIDKKLDILVEPNAAHANAEGRTTLTLSGGEKSFSTVCLLLSIWEAMGSPIRCLDEFDVFMDSVNRNLSLNLIIQAARRSVGRQYIFITPQSMQSGSYGTDVAIHKMSDPERGQTALPFTQA